MSLKEQDLLLISDLEKENRMTHMVTFRGQNDVGCFEVSVKAFTSVLTDVANEGMLS